MLLGEKIIIIFFNPRNDSNAAIVWKWAAQPITTSTPSSLNIIQMTDRAWKTDSKEQLDQKWSDLSLNV